jgi:uncharacterized protein (DUF58 family)
MRTDDIIIEHDQPLLTRWRIWYFLALALLAISLIGQQPIAFLAAFFISLIAFVPDYWYRQALRHLVFTQRVSQHNVFFGEEVTLSMSIENQKFLPLPWLYVENPITPPLTLLRKRTLKLQKVVHDTISSTWLFWSFQRVTRSYRILCQSRGIHVFGPIRMGSSDPFGWLEREVRLPLYEMLLVYPLTVPLETLGLASIRPQGEYATQRYLLEDPLRFAGVRDYVIGDDPRRIHWKASAHTGALRSKIYEPSSLRRLLVLLDAWNYSDLAKGPDLDIQELTITAAASIGVWALEEGYLLGLLANCAIMTTPVDDEPSNSALADAGAAPIEYSPVGVRIPFASEPGQYEQLLSTLARLAPAINVPIEQLIESKEGICSPGTTIILLSATSSLSQRTLEGLVDLRRRGTVVYLALTGGPTSASTALLEQYDIPVFCLGGKEKWRELVTTARDRRSTTAGTSTISLQLA